MKITFLLAIYVLAIASALVAGREPESATDTCIVSLVGQSDEAMLASVNSIECKQPTIRITSIGGEGTVSLKIAEAIKAKQATLIVDKYCFSSCAEFLLAAADKVIFEDKPLIGFHGNPPMKKFFANHYKIPELAICEFEDLSKMKQLYDASDLNLDFWKAQLSALQLRKFVVQSDAPEGQCPSMTLKFEHELWFPDSKILKQGLNLDFEGTVCSDEVTCDQRLERLFSSGSFVVGDKIVNVGSGN